MIRQILFPTKAEERSRRWLEALLPLQRVGLEAVHLLFVRQESFARTPAGQDGATESETAKDPMRIQLEEWASQVRATGIACSCSIEYGDPEVTILEVAERISPDIIAMGRQLQVLPGTVYLGGTTMGLVRRSPVPVLVCKSGRGASHPAPEVSELFSRLLFATDFGPASRVAASFVAGLTNLAHRIDVVHVLPVQKLREAAPSELDRIREEAWLGLNDLGDRLGSGGADVLPHLLGGDPKIQLLQAARDYRSSLLVVGTTGKSGFKALWLGSVSQNVVESCPCPVVLIPPGLQTAAREAGAGARPSR